MKNFNFFEKLWEHSRTLRRVGLVLVMCLTTITQVWAGEPYIDEFGFQFRHDNGTTWKKSPEDADCINGVDWGSKTNLKIVYIYANAKCNYGNLCTDYNYLKYEITKDGVQVVDNWGGTNRQWSGWYDCNPVYKWGTENSESAFIDLVSNFKPGGYQMNFYLNFEGNNNSGCGSWYECKHSGNNWYFNWTIPDPEISFTSNHTPVMGQPVTLSTSVSNWPTGMTIKSVTYKQNGTTINTITSGDRSSTSYTHTPTTYGTGKYTVEVVCTFGSAGDVTYTRNMDITQSYDVTYGTHTNGSFTIAVPNVSASSSSKKAASGQRVNISATGNTGYVFSSWDIYKTGTPATKITPNASTATTYFTMPSYGVTVDATFSAKTYSISLDRQQGSSGSTSVTMTYNSSSHTSITAPTAPTGYTFAGWYTGALGTGSMVMNASGVLQANVDGYTGAGGVWKKDGTCTLYAKYTASYPDGYLYITDVKSNPEAGATAAISGATYNASLNGSFAHSGLEYWALVGGSTNTYTLTFASAITASATAAGVAVDVWWGANGTSSNSGTTIYLNGTDAAHKIGEAAATTDTRNQLLETLKNVRAVGTTSVSSLQLKRYNANSTAWFRVGIKEIPGYRLTYNVGDGTGAPSASYQPNATITLSSAKPTYAGHLFAGWQVNGSGTVYQPGDSFDMPAEATTLVAKWEENCYQGTITKSSGNLTASHGGETSLTASDATITSGGGIKIVNTNTGSGSVNYACSSDGMNINTTNGYIEFTLPSGSVLATGSIIRVQGKTGNNSYGLKIIDDSGNEIAKQTNNGAIDFTYTVTSQSAINGNDHVRINRVTNNGTIIKAVTVAGCGSVSCSTPTSPTITGTTNYTAGENISLTASATGTDGSTTYTWYKGDNWAAASATSSIGSAATYTKASCVVGDAGTYWCNISNGDGCEVQVSKTITVVCVSHSVNLSSSGSVTGGTFETSSATVCVGETATLTATPSSGYTFTSWSATGTGSSLSSTTTNPATLTMGTADVTVNATFTPIPVATITLNKTETTLTYGGSPETLSVTSVLPANALDRTYTWSSSNDAVATVTSGGVVSPVAAGSCEIYATANDGSGVKGTCAVTVNKADLSVTATAGTATSVTHNSATLPFTLSSTTGVASVTINVYLNSNDSKVATISDVTAATSGSASATGLSASTTYYFKVKPIGDANHNDGSESAKSATFTTSAAPTLTAIEAGVVYDADEMIPDGQTVTEGDVIFNNDSYSEGNLFYTKAGSKGPKANTGDQPNITIGEGQVYEASFKSNMMYIKGTATLSGTPKIPSAPSIKFKIPAGGGTLYLYGPTNTTAKFIKEGDAEGTAIANTNKYISVEVDGGDICYVYGSSDDKSGFYGLKLVTCTDPGLAFAEDSKTTTLCDAAPTNALTNTHNVAVSYTSSDETVATVASDGTLTIKKAGTTTITASSIAQTVSAVDYCADEASYTLTVSASTAAGLAYGTATVKKDVDDAAFTNTLTNSNDLTVTYTSSDEDVATIDSDGEVTIKAAGTTTITASSAQQKVSSTCYAAGSATYSLTVYPVYTVTYDATDGTCSTVSAMTETGEVTLPTPTHASYSFDGWYTTAGVKAGNAGAKYSPSGNITLYAKWSGSCAGGGGSTTIYAMHMTAYNSYSNDESTTGTTTLAFASDNTVTVSDVVYYKPNSTNAIIVDFSESDYTLQAGDVITFYCVGSDDKSSKTVGFAIKASKDGDAVGTAYVLTAAKTRAAASYTVEAETALVGVNKIWCTRKDGDTRFHDMTITRGGGTCYTVTYDGNGATGGYTNDPAQYAKDADPEVLDCGYTRTGYAFMGWADGTDHRDAGTVDYQPGDHITSISDDVKLYAIWKQIKYFTTEGNWNTSDNWSPSGVPARTDPVVIQANVMVDTDEAKALSVDIESGNTLTIGAGKALIIEKTLTKAGGGATAAADVVINSDRTTAGVGALIIGGETGTNKATVNFETKVKRESGTGNWINQFIGSPFSDLEPYVDYALQIYEFRPADDGNRGFWHKLSSGDGMKAFWGYNVLYNDNDYLDVQWTGTLNASSNNVTKAGSYEVQTDNLFANSWVAPIHIAAFEEGDFTNFDPTIYIFNAGTPQQEQEMSSDVNANTAAGTYATIPINSSSWLGGTLKVIPAMQAFFVKATGASPSIKLDYSKLVYTPALTSVDITPTRAPRRSAEVAPEVIRLHVAGENGWAENTYVLGREDFTEGYDRGWDGRYMEGEDTNPQLYTPTTDGYMAVNCVPEIEGTVVGFRKGSSDNNYIFSFDYDGDEVWYLNDQKAQKSTQIMNGQTYAFESEAGDNAARFVISATPINKIATGCESVGAEAAKVRKVIIDDKVYIIRGGQVFDVLGKTIKK